MRFVVLDSQDGVNVTPGLLGGGQLAWLARDLDAHPETPAVVFVHHNLNANSESALRDTTGLLDVLRPRRQAKAVVFGHTHVWNVQKIEDIHMINLPAIGYRFRPEQPLGWAILRPEPDGAEIELRCIGGGKPQAWPEGDAAVASVNFLAITRAGSSPAGSASHPARWTRP